MTVRNYIKQKLISICNWIFSINNVVGTVYAFVLLVFLFYGFKNITYVKITIWPSLIGVFIIIFRKDIFLLLSNLELILPNGWKFQNNRAQEEVTTKKEAEKCVEKIFDNNNSNVVEEVDKTCDDIAMERLKKENIGLSIENRTNVTIIDFERICKIIYKSQIELLQILSGLKENGYSQYQIQNYFDSVARKNPFYAHYHWGLSDYMRFLILKDLVETNSDYNYIITKYGLYFLDYLKLMQYDKLPYFY